MTLCDLMNAMGMLDECCAKMIEHIESGYPDKALVRAKETRRQIKKIQAKFGNGYVKKAMPPHKAQV